MTLFEQYQTLLRRGCPAHPRLKAVITRMNMKLLDAADADWQDVVYWEMPGTVAGNITHPDDARDLLTQHALRWIEGMPVDIYRPGQLGKWNVVVSSTIVGDHTRETLLAAIIAATGHLEPKEQP